MEAKISSNLKATFIKPPSYFKPVYFPDGETDKIELVYLEELISDFDIISPKHDTTVSNDDTATLLDVTGSPLEVDLRGDDSFINLKSEIPLPWPQEELSHLPLDVKSARCYINQQMKIKNRTQVPLFVVCDGENPQETVLIGVQRSNTSLFSCILNVVGCCPKNDEKISLDAMEKSHRILSRVKDCKINYLAIFKYYVFGRFLRNIKDIYSSEHYGSISIEIGCNEKCHSDLPEKTRNIKKMILQTIAGHKMSSVHFLWEDLCLLQNYLNILHSDMSNNADRLLSPSPMVTYELFENIKNIVGTNFWKRETKMAFDLQHIRHEGILDKLWNVLKYCEDLGTLREAFHLLFEELAESESNFKIPENYSSNIAIIINGIIDGKFAVPTLTCHQALEFLFEIGAAKFKNDYQSIIKHFYSTSDTTISQKWSQLQKKLLLADTNRKTRSTLNLKAGAKTVDEHASSQLAYLGKLHIATELIYLVQKQIFLPEDTFDFVCERVFKHYVDRDVSMHDFSELQENPLCEFETVIDTGDESVIKTELPVSWSLRMTTSSDNFETTTVYHLSKDPLIPTTIFNKYDVSSITEEDSMTYYVCKFESHLHKNIC